MHDSNISIITDQQGRYDLEVVECRACGFHLGIDATYLEQVDGVSLACPGCGIGLTIAGEGDEDGATTPYQSAARAASDTPARTLAEALPADLLAFIRDTSPPEHQTFLTWEATSAVGSDCLRLVGHLAQVTNRLDSVVDRTPLYEAVAHQMRIYAYS